MIKDNIKNYLTYKNFGKNLLAGFEYLFNTDLVNLECGRYDIIKDKVYASVQDYETRYLEDAKLESHKKYIDIQFIVRGSEKIGVSTFCAENISEGYDEVRDLIFYQNKNIDCIDFITMNEGDFAVFFPQDLHMPCLKIKQPSYVKKVVVKVLI